VYALKHVFRDGHRRRPSVDVSGVPKKKVKAAQRKLFIQDSEQVNGNVDSKLRVSHRILPFSLLPF
jgi:hypothetical protein